MTDIDVVQVSLNARDYANDMRALIDKYRRQTSYNASLIAHDIVEELLKGDRELLYGWLQAHAVPTIRAAVTAADAATRSYARTRGNSVFAEVDTKTPGQKAPIRQGFLQAVYVVDSENTRKALRDMTADDVMFVASRYDDRAKSAQLDAAFLRAVAKRIGKQRLVGDVYNNTQLDDLRVRLTGKDS